MSPPTLLQPLQLGPYLLQNRVVMAPLTRMRAASGNTPHELNAAYYRQRAGAGLIIAEATQVVPQGQGYPSTPGIHSGEQVGGWRKVTEAVHAAGGRIFLQLWHVGRISHSSFQPDGGLPVAPSAIAPRGKTLTADWKSVPYETPRALETAELPAIVAGYRQAAINARNAGFDGVEVHGANGYLLDQFLQDGSNRREDRYGGSVENRARLLLETVDAVTEVWGAGRVGVRLSPYGTFNDMSDSDYAGHFTQIIGWLSQRRLGYLHLIEPRATSAGGSDQIDHAAPDAAAAFRKAFSGVLISAGGYTPQTAQAALAQGQADAVAFGRLFIANPDLPRRIEQQAPLNAYERATFYGGGAKGYTDYPSLEGSGA